MAKVCIIVGHGKGKSGDYDPGATANGFQEFKVAREIAKYACDSLNNEYDISCDLMNYTGDRYLSDRINRANALGYSFIAEVHLNAGGGNGVECYYSKKDTNGRNYADKICKCISADIGLPQRTNSGTDRISDIDKDGGDKTKLNSSGRDYFGIIRQTKMTAVLIETAFIDTKSNINKIDALTEQEICGKAIARGIAETMGASKTVATPVINIPPAQSTTFGFTKGQIVNFAGGFHYKSSNSSLPSGTKRKSGTARITNIRVGVKHPYHLVGVTGSNVYGWVDENTVSPVPTVFRPNIPAQTVLPSVIRINSKVKINEGAYYGGNSKGVKVPKRCIGVTYTVSQVRSTEALINELYSWVPIYSLTLVS